MIDWDAHVIGPTVGVFGEPCTFMPIVGTPYPVSGVFDEEYHAVDLADGMGMTTDMPVLGVQISQFAAQPKQGDQVFIARLNATYVVKEVRPDGHGAAKLMLNFVS